MRKALVAASAAYMVMGAPQAQTEPTNLVRVIAYVVTVTGAVKAVIETYDWVRARWFPPPAQFERGHLWRCDTCNFPGAGGVATPTDDVNGRDFIARQFGDRGFTVGQAIMVCDDLNCMMFRYDGEQWFASGPSIKNPGIGYANKPPAPSNHRGGGETRASDAPGSSTVWHPSVVYNPGSHLRTGSVTMTFESFGDGDGDGDGSGGGGGGSRFPGVNDSE